MTHFADAPHILLVVTSARQMGTPAQPTGLWLEEFAAPYYAFVEAGCRVTVASPEGGAVTLDPTGLEDAHQTESTHRFHTDAAAQAVLLASVPLEGLRAQDFDALYAAGGHGTMEDFPHSRALRALIEALYAADKPIASVCHGPACLVSCMKSDGTPLVRGHRFTCFSEAEECAIGAQDRVPFPLEYTLTALGGKPQMAAHFAANVLEDAPLLTGQNPASSLPLAHALLRALGVPLAQGGEEARERKSKAPQESA